MNKRDFYKELMSEYMFDKEKICANAKKGKLAGRRPLPIYIGMTAAVAAVVVTVGTITATSLDRRNVARIETGKGITALSNEQRLERAIAEAQRNEGSEARMDVYITFRTQLSVQATQNLLLQFSGSGTPVKMLHMADGSKVLGTAEVTSAFRSGSGEVIAAVLNCPGYKLSEINANEFVLLAEPVSENDNIMDIDPVDTTIDVPDVSTSVDNNSKPNVPDIGDNNNSGGNTHEPPGIDDIPGGDDDPDPGSNSSDPGVSDPNGSNPGNEDPNPSGDPNSSGEEPPEPPVPPTATAPSIPAGVTLPYDIEKQSFITDDLGAQKAYFLSENVFYVKSENAVALYKWNNGKEALAARQEITDAKVAWVSENGLRMMVSGTENGVRRKLYIIDAKNCTINDMQVSEMVGEGSIAEAAYNESRDIFALNVLDADSRYIYTAKLSGYQPSDPQIAAYGSSNLSLLAAYNGAVYYSESIGTTTIVYKYEKGENYEVKVLDSLYVSVLNSAFTHASMVSANGLGIFDPATESVISLKADKISFGASTHSFSDGKSYFTISSGAIVPESGISAIAKVDFTRSFSSKWMAAVSNGSVRILPGVYTARVKSNGITFAQPEEKAAAVQRSSVNAAIGVINALASETCKDCGINTSEKLISVIDACFSADEARFIKACCEVSESGELSYTSGGFTAVNVSDTVLVMDSEYKGTLYIKAGTFDGRAAYRTVPVVLVEENGKLLMNAAV